MEASIYRLRLRDILTACVLALLAMGVLMVQSASTTLTADAVWQWSPLGQKHLLYVVCSILTFFLVGQIDYARLGRPPASRWRSPVLWAFLLAWGACAVVLVPHVGARINGAQRWLKIGQITLQPSELAKWAVVLFLAYWLTRPQTDIRRLFRGLIPTLIPIGLICLLVVLQDFGTAALIGLCALTMLLAGRMRIRHLVLLTIPVILAAGFFVLHSTGGYRMRRITAFLHPYDSPQGEGYHMIQSLLTFSTGGVFGRGLGNGIQKLGYLPEDTTDFIFAVVCEELGLFGAMLTVALYLGVLFVAWQVIRQKRDDFGRMLAFGIGSMIGLQAAINIAVATVSVPTKGLSLPLISAGGSGLVITCGALGLLYSITRYRHPVAEDAPETVDAVRLEDPGIPASA
jgi:cell division protein FtsW